MIRIGTCSWKYDSWRGLVYSNKDNLNYLEEYSKKYNTVEIDQWFWSLHDINKITLPQKNVVKEYNDAVPDKFKFTVKIPNSLTLTHFYNKTKTEPLKVNPYFLNVELFNAFLKSLDEMKSKIGVLMFQFEYLNKQKMTGLKEFVKRFEEFLKNIDRNLEYGIEIRNPNYLNKEYFDFLIRNNLRMVFLQGYYMPPIWEVMEKCKDNLSKQVVIRLHGGDRKDIEEKSNNEWNKIIIPRDYEITKVMEMINFLIEKKIDIYINVNNHFEGSAPLTIEKLKVR